LAEAEANAGETDAGRRRLDDALAELECIQQRWYEAEMHHLRAGILLKRNPADTAAAEQSLQTAIAIAQSQKARGFELRAALSLAKHYHAANRDAASWRVSTLRHRRTALPSHEKIRRARLRLDSGCRTQSRVKHFLEVDGVIL
jgi:hypothetical protein